MRRIVLALALAAAGSAAPPAFRAARPMWPEGLEREKNLTVGWRASFDVPPAGATLRLTGSTLYRLYVNGAFRGYGPARAGHGWYRVDEWSLPPGRNTVAIEVAGYNVNSYYVLDQPSFLQAEAVAGDRVLASTGGAGSPFAAAIVSERIQKVQRYSFQRPFSEVWSLRPGWAEWRTGGPFPEVRATPAGERRLLARGVPYPEFRVRQAGARVGQGTMRVVVPAKLWKDRGLTQVGPLLGGFPEAELTTIPSIELQKMASAPGPEPAGARLDAGQYQILDFGTNLSGFIGSSVVCRKKGRLYFTFDEILSAGDVNFRRLGCVNAVVWDLEPGTYELESFEPYTLRYLKLIAGSGEFEAAGIRLREYANPDTAGAHFASSDEGLNRLFEAARETYRQNAVDLFMDCPSRERAGWLCDSFFTARVEQRLAGGTAVERNFFENYLLPEKFAHLPDGMLPMCYPADHRDGRFIPNWALWFVVQLEEYGARSGDRATIDALRPRVMRLFDYLGRFRNSGGLLENLPSWVFIEWSKANDFVQNVNYPSNMLYAGALAAAARLYGDAALARQAEGVRETVRRQSFDGEFFVDNAVRANGVLVRTRNRTEVCQYFAFYFGAATPESHPALWRVLRERFGPQRSRTGAYPEIHPANAFVGNVMRLELLSRLGLGRQIVGESRSYLLYMADRTGTLWENVDPSASCNHGFASHAVETLFRDVLGLARVDTVRKRVDLRFTDASLEWCEGRAPVPGGAVALRWWREGGGRSYHVNAPVGWAVTVENRSGQPLKAR